MQPCSTLKEQFIHELHNRVQGLGGFFFFFFRLQHLIKKKWCDVQSYTVITYSWELVDRS